ncbi:arylamine N-acetyltransferase [Saccharopolyspora sp. NPDC050642]|uniref:arylamine N-acetyltransferase family protein n=1 Tax=Saccharopolyspora sp. NPDC050642 TaxID=3157099 RepID=UPI0033FF5720
MSTPTHPSYRWSGEDLDLDAYLARIGFEGDRAPTVATLRRLVYLHTTTIPFENLEIVLGRPVLLDVKSLQDKMVRQRRGGYCYENSALFAAVLERLGFGVIGLGGRIFIGPDNGPLPATHAVLRVTTAEDDRAWLCDVGFGSGPMEPIELTPSDGELTIGGWRFRLELGADELGAQVGALHHFSRNGWLNRRTFTMTPQYRIDYEVGSHYVSTSSHSPFTTRPIAQKFHPEVHHLLDGVTLNTQYPDGTGETRDVDRADLPEILSETFDIDLDDADATQLVEQPWPADQRP